MIAITRRAALFGLAGFGLFGGCRGEAGAPPSLGRVEKGAVSRVLVFTPEQLPTIDAVVETILPGAAAAGVSGYLSFWLATKPFEATRRFLLHGLGLVDKRAIEGHRQRFAACEPAAREAVLRAFAEGAVRSRVFDGALFFQQMTELVLEGYLSDPKYGGNRDRVGWRFIGIPDGLQSCWWNPNGIAGVLGHD